MTIKKRSIAAANVLSRRMAIAQASAGTVRIVAVAGFAAHVPEPPPPAAPRRTVDLDGVQYDVEVWQAAAPIAVALGVDRMSAYHAIMGMLDGPGRDLVSFERTALIAALGAYADMDRRIIRGAVGPDSIAGLASGRITVAAIDLGERANTSFMKAIGAANAAMLDSMHVPAELMEEDPRNLTTGGARDILARQQSEAFRRQASPLTDRFGRPL